MVEKIKEYAKSKQPENRLLALYFARSEELNDADLSEAIGSIFAKIPSIESDRTIFNSLFEMEQKNAKLFLSYLGNL